MINQTAIKVVGFLIGFFITLFIITYVNIQNKKLEKFEVKIPTKEAYTNSSTSTSNQHIITTQLPYKSFKYFHITTFNDTNKINNSQGKWFENDLKIEKYNENNEYHYFNYNKAINLRPNTINKNGSVGADLTTIELLGPKSFYFANNIHTNELNEFSMVISCKIRELNSSNNILFEMTGNTETIITTHNNIESINYQSSMININIQPNINNNYNFILTIGNNHYRGNINNIDNTIIKNSDLLMIGLLYTNSEITVLINKQMYKYVNTNNFKIKLGSTPVIINKNGRLSLDLYNFIYYKSILPVNEYLNIYTYNYHYLSGLSNVIATSTTAISTIKQLTETKEDKCKLEAKEVETAKITKRLDELENSIGKCFKPEEKKEKEKDEEISPLEMKLIDKIGKSSNFFSFLF